MNYMLICWKDMLWQAHHAKDWKAIAAEPHFV